MKRILSVSSLAALGATSLLAQAPSAAPPTVADLVPKIAAAQSAGDNAWMLASCALVLLMTGPGLALFYGGLVRRKNVLGTMMQSFILMVIATIMWALFGYSLSFGDGNAFIGDMRFAMMNGVGMEPNTDYAPTIPHLTWMAFQMMFAIITPALITGAFAERMKFSAMVLFTILWSLLIYYPMAHMVWGKGGLLNAFLGGTVPCLDFAGGTVVHITSGVSALICAVVMGKRLGYPKEPMRPHSLVLSFIGACLLWFGWFGFNPGSTMSVAGDGGRLAAQVAVNTNSAAAAATITATITAWLLLGKPDIGMTLNGCLAGLVGITASAAYVTVPASMLIGAVAGVIVVFSVMFFDRLKIDDPVGATSVHLVCGILGTLCVGLFNSSDLSQSVVAGPFGSMVAGGPKAGLFYGGGVEQLWIQLLGVLAVGAYVAPVSAICWFILKFAVGLRVSPHEEIEGLDIGEHGNEAYHGFQLIRTE